MERRKTRKVRVGDKFIGGDAPVLVQSMCNKKTKDVKGVLKQIDELAEAGCELVRVTVNTQEAADAMPAIVKGSQLPVCADIHFDYRMALAAVKAGVAKVRINPGNIGSEDKVKTVVKAVKDAGIPIRIGVNSGSIEKKLLEKYGYPTPEAAVESAFGHVKILEELDFRDIVISVKFSDTLKTIQAYELLSKKCDYPLHLGVTEAGTKFTGTVKSSIALGSLLSRGIGDTIRVSLTDDPVEEVHAAYEILKVLGIRAHGPILTSCPTCGRTEIDLIPLAKRIEERLKKYKEPLKVAVMGCVVNRPGEAAECDVGITGGKGVGIVFRKGKVVRNVKESELFDALFEEIDQIIAEGDY
ncbi:MAG: flavodoxin-dependent (E)-4-hydroxy-3-methylbut-2-enyl-diphosphate synthase [Candidatus Micrarchaeota archaeon]